MVLESIVQAVFVTEPCFLAFANRWIMTLLYHLLFNVILEIMYFKSGLAVFVRDH